MSPPGRRRRVHGAVATWKGVFSGGRGGLDTGGGRGGPGGRGGGAGWGVSRERPPSRSGRVAPCGAGRAVRGGATVRVGARGVLSALGCRPPRRASPGASRGLSTTAGPGDG